MLFVIMSAVVLVFTLALTGVIPADWVVPILLVVLVVSALGYRGYKLVGAVLAVGSFWLFMTKFGGGGNGAKLVEIVVLLCGIWIMLWGIFGVFRRPDSRA